ncbi:cache domain-containing protein [Blautia massiliensis (ex Durand et al. 2017)]|uniref:cache domain-containing protein n=1 Tax=Blautia massiliensis (ex Durand et al. 2017) TaxID=1737424 RepID=UPI00241CEDEF|nr:cache domain-containing protein [Blautia massiliensis (ex Durand et al. 2017)]
MKKNHFELKNYVMATGVFILAVVAGILIFFECVQRSVQVNSQNTLKINVQRQSEHLRTILDINYQYLNEIASAMGRSEELFSEENKERLVSIYEKTDLERAALIDKNGDAYYDNGVTKNVSHRRYFQEAISGEQTISDPLESSVDHEVRVVLGVPIYKDHKVIGVLGGSCNVTALSHMLFNDLFDGTGNSFLATSDGELIAFDIGSASGTEITYGINLFKYYGEKILKGSMLFRTFRKILKLAKEVW